MPVKHGADLHKFDFFDCYSSGELQRLVRRARSVEFKPDAQVFAQDDFAENFYFLMDGHIRVNKLNANGQEVIVQYLTTGDVFGISPLVSTGRHSVTTTTVVPCEVMIWPTIALEELCAEIPNFALKILRALSMRLHRSQEHAMKLATAQVDQRIASTVLRLVRQTGKKNADGGIEIDFPITRREIAQMSATTLHTVSRTLRRLEAEGILSTVRKRIVVTKPHQLMLLSEARED